MEKMTLQIGKNVSLKNHNAKNFLFVFLLVASLMSGLTLFPVLMTTADAKTGTSVTVKVGTEKVKKKQLH